MCTIYCALLFTGTPEASEKSCRNMYEVRFGADPQLPAQWRIFTAMIEWPHLVSRPHLAKVTRKRWKTPLTPTKDTQLCLWYSRSEYVWGLNHTCEHRFLQEGHPGEKVLLHSGWILHLVIWGTSYNILRAYIETFARKKPLRLGQIPTLGTLSELQNNELHSITSFICMCMLCKCEHG